MDLSDVLDTLSRRAFGRTKAEAHADVSCIRCSEPVVLGAMSRRDAAEYMISGVCPKCFTELFPDEDD